MHSMHGTAAVVRLHRILKESLTDWRRSEISLTFKQQHKPTAESITGAANGIVYVDVPWGSEHRSGQT